MFQLAIFDLNGTIIEDESVWHLAFNNVFKRHGGIGEFPNKPGIGNHDNWRFVQQQDINFQKFTADTLSFETKDEYINLVRQYKLGLRNGYQDLMSYLNNRSVVCILATSSSLEALKSVGTLYPEILKSFEVIVHGDEVEHRKPAPDIFLKALEKVNTISDTKYIVDDCVIFEDSNTGVKAAKSANMYVVHLPNGIEENDTTLSPNLVAKDFTDKRIYELFNEDN